MEFRCKYCKIHFEIKTFEQLEKFHQIPVTEKSQCFITRKGVPHDLKPFFKRSK